MSAGRKARSQGIRHEREVASHLRSMGFQVEARARHGWAREPGRGDMEVAELPGWHVECKNYQDQGRAIREALAHPQLVVSEQPPTMGIVKRRGKGVQYSLVVLELRWLGRLAEDLRGLWGRL